MNHLLFLLASALMLVGCASKAMVYKDVIPVHDSLTIASTFVQEDRIINIWTPPSYENSNDHLPVLYMPDGGIKEDFPHIANTLAKLIASKEIPPFILVGIENTVRGRNLTGASNVQEHEKYQIPMTDGAKDFRDFITLELMPEINKRYRTSAKKGIIGESLAGLFVMETFFLKPQSFDYYIAMDPSLWWNGNSLVENAEVYLDSLPNKEIKLWFAGSDAGDISKYTRQLAKKLENQPSEKLIWNYSDEPKEKHNTIFRATKEKALIWILN